MASRDRRGSGRPNAARRPAASAVTSPGNAVLQPTKPSISDWDGVFQTLTPEERSVLLTLAGRQGLLHAHQIPISRNGTASAPEDIARIMDGDLGDVEPVRPDEVPIFDTALDDAQRGAVARAVASTDVCLIQGLPGTGKSRVTAEILRQLADRGERVLVLSRTAACTDRIVELIEPYLSILSIRLLAPGDRADDLPPASRTATIGERAKRIRADSLEQTEKRSAQLEHECAQLRLTANNWEPLERMAKSFEELESRHDKLCRHRDRVSSEVEQEAATSESSASPVRNALAQAIRRRDETLATLDERVAECHGRISALRQDETKLVQAADQIGLLSNTLNAGRWWTTAWWQARRQRSRLTEQPALAERLRKIRSDISDAEAEAYRLTQTRLTVEQAYEIESKKLIQEEIDHRRVDWDRQLASLDQEHRQLLGEWETACARVDLKLRPAAPTRTCVDQSRAAYRESLDRAAREQSVLVQWLTFLRGTDRWPEGLHQSANVVAAPANVFKACPDFANALTSTFDTLVLQEAEHFTEAEFLSFARHARRCVLVGEPAPPRCAKVFDQLWQRLHWDPSQLPYSWLHEGDRLCCRLRTVPAEQCKYLEVESLADSPEIELRILTVPGSPPTLAEVAFAPSYSIAAAKEHIFRELEELAAETTGRSAYWIEDPERIRLRFLSDAIPTEATATLTDGVRELIGARPVHPSTNGGGAPWQTIGFEFDRTAGWDRARAELWIQQRLGLRDLGRTVRLDTAHRCHPHLAAFWSHVLPGGGYHGALAASINGCAPRVEFVPVPRWRDNSVAATQNVALSRKGGAGLEIDLADPRQRTRLPSDLLTFLPARGLVNHAEAQAVVHALGAMAAGAAGNSAMQPVAVLALYAAQVDLIRLLVRRAPSLLSKAAEVSIETPDAFRERESPIVFLSLTRSHSHRAITFGDGPETLSLALTRAQSRLVIFGDTGALAQRAEWDGPLEHLDGSSAARERTLIGGIVQHIEGHGACSTVFSVCEAVRA